MFLPAGQMVFVGCDQSIGWWSRRNQAYLTFQRLGSEIFKTAGHHSEVVAEQPQLSKGFILETGEQI
jgi:hypothetical protein